jgi:hypothetical protein
MLAQSSASHGHEIIDHCIIPILGAALPYDTLCEIRPCPYIAEALTEQELEIRLLPYMRIHIALIGCLFRPVTPLVFAKSLLEPTPSLVVTAIATVFR